MGNLSALVRDVAALRDLVVALAAVALPDVATTLVLPLGLAALQESRKFQNGAGRDKGRVMVLVSDS